MGAAGTRQMRTVFRDKDLMKTHLGLDHEDEKEQLKKSLEAGTAKGGTRLSRFGNIIEEFTKSHGGAARRSSVIDYLGQKYHSAILGQSTAQKLREKEEGTWGKLKNVSFSVAPKRIMISYRFCMQ